jgi:hypothetical protein
MIIALRAKVFWGVLKRNHINTMKTVHLMTIRNILPSMAVGSCLLQ